LNILCPRERRVFQSKLGVSSSNQCNLHYSPHTGNLEKKIKKGYNLFRTRCISLKKRRRTEQSYRVGASFNTPSTERSKSQVLFMTSANLSSTFRREEACFLSPPCLNGCRTRPASKKN